MIPYKCHCCGYEKLIDHATWRQAMKNGCPNCNATVQQKMRCKHAHVVAQRKETSRNG